MAQYFQFYFVSGSFNNILLVETRIIPEELQRLIKLSKELEKYWATCSLPLFITMSWHQLKLILMVVEYRCSISIACFIERVKLKWDRD